MRNNFYWVFQQPVYVFQKGHASLWQFTRVTSTSHTNAQISQTRNLLIDLERSYRDYQVCLLLYKCVIEETGLKDDYLAGFFHYLVPTMSALTHAYRYPLFESGTKTGL